VNFFGHATVASWHSDEPAFALGAMLPDLLLAHVREALAQNIGRSASNSAR
jgi:hypothetical protein